MNRTSLTFFYFFFFFSNINNILLLQKFNNEIYVCLMVRGEKIYIIDLTNYIKKHEQTN